MSIPSSLCFALMYSNAKVALSFITVPRFPVILSVPFPLDKILSMNKISPPTFVQASPVTTPISLVVSETALLIGMPKISSIFLMLILGSYSLFIVICSAVQRAIAAKFFSNLLTPLSLVWASMMCFSSFEPNFNSCADSPCSWICFFSRCLLAISTFSSKVYPERLMISIRSSSALWIVERLFAVAMNITFDKS